MGPVQVLVLGYDAPAFSGEALAEVRRLEAAGIVRLVDLLLVTRDDAGQLHVVETDQAHAGAVAVALLGEQPGGDAEAPPQVEAEPGWSLADAVPEGGAAAVVLLEHLWAEGLVAAIRRTGGRPLDEMWLSEGDRALLE
jgi:Family of unknown function (DUF6325)